MMIMMFSKHPNRDKGEKTISEGEIWDEKGGGDGAERTQKDTSRKKEVKMNRSEESIQVGKCPFLLWIFHTTWDTNWDQFYVFTLRLLTCFCAQVLYCTVLLVIHVFGFLSAPPLVSALSSVNVSYCLIVTAFMSWCCYIHHHSQQPSVSDSLNISLFLHAFSYPIFPHDDSV